MRRCESVRVLGGIVAGLRPRRLLVVAIAVLALLPTDISEAGWLPDFFKSSPKHAKPPKRATATRPAKLEIGRASCRERV